MVVVGGYIAIRPAAPNLRHSRALPADAELQLTKSKPYGWSAAMAVGTRFTDGLNFMTVTSVETRCGDLSSRSPVAGRR